MQNQIDKALRYKRSYSQLEMMPGTQDPRTALTSAYLMLLLINSGKTQSSSWLCSDLHYLLVHNLTSFWTSLSTTCSYLVYRVVFLWDTQQSIFLCPSPPHCFTERSNPSSLVTTWAPVSGSECPLYENWIWLTWTLLCSALQGDTS